MFVILFIIIATLVGVSLIGLGLNIFFRKGGKFPQTHIGRNKAMKDRGITCASSTDREERKNYKPVNIKK